MMMARRNGRALLIPNASRLQVRAASGIAAVEPSRRSGIRSFKVITQVTHLGVGVTAAEHRSIA
eukprot:SAG11_NODE_17397_length_520_cov_0.676960_1_plen_64_part_10